MRGHPLLFLLFSFTIASVASDMSLYINGFSILFSDILRDAIELSSFAVFAISLSTCPLAGVLNIAVSINGSAKVLFGR